MGNKRKADCTPEEWAGYAAMKSASKKTPEYRAKQREYHKKYRDDPEKCERIRQKNKVNNARYYADPDYRRRQAELKRYRSYGLSPEDFNLLRQLQGNKCGICRKDLKPTDYTKPGKDYRQNEVVDHCHASGRVRGLLCHRCNGMEGWFSRYKDGIEQYLRHPPATVLEIV